MSMDAAKTFSRRSFVVVFLFLALLLIGVNGGLIYCLNQIQSGLEPLRAVEADSVQLKAGLVSLEAQVTRLQRYFPLASAGGFLLVGLILWGFLRRMGRGILAMPRAGAPKKAAAKAQKEAPAAPAADPQRDTRVFLHLLSVLQREGRLLDFFSEKLEGYDDAQIGAAVRGIHESCQKALKKYLRFKSVIANDEGAEVTVEPGFDPSAIKLVGNVTGEPPFRGILRHQGWRAEKVELPVLSGGQTPSIISPAEVEIS
jgi:hypothetical protein